MYNFNQLHSFISPLSGRILSPEDYTPYGDRKDIATPSPILFDIRLDLLKLKQQIEEIDRLNDLSQGKIWIGDINNQPSQRQTIEVSNLPSLGVASISGLDLPAGKIWRGTSSGRPEESNALSETIADVFAINARLLAGNFIMGNAPVKALWPAAQFLSSLDDGMLKKTGSVLQHAVAGTDYVDTTDEVFDDERIALIKQNNKLIKRSTIRVLEGSRILDLTSLGVGTIQASNQITSDESIFATNDIGSREVKIYDFWNNEGRLTKSFNLKGPTQFLANINYIVPTTSGTTGQVLADIGQDIGSTYRKLGFVTAGANSAAKYILQQPQAGMNNAQALSELTSGILKSTTATGIISIASGGKTPEVNDFVRPVDLAEEIAEANEAAAAEAAAAGAAAIAAAHANLDAEMLPFLPIPLVTYGAQITTAIGVATAAAAAAEATAASKLSSVSGTADQIAVSGGDTIAIAENPIIPGQYAVFPSVATLPETLIAGAIYFMEVVDDD